MILILIVGSLAPPMSPVLGYVSNFLLNCCCSFLPLLNKSICCSTNDIFFFSGSGIRPKKVAVLMDRQHLNLGMTNLL